MYIKIVNGNPISYSLRQLKSDNPNVSFPKTMPEALLNSYDVYTYTRLDVPEYDPLIQQITESSFEQDAAGAWSIGYNVVNVPEAEAAQNIRMDRDIRLSETDYLALSDNTLSSEMAQYRADLRAVPQQSGFPFSVTWPTKP